MTEPDEAEETFSPDNEDLAGIWQKMGQLNEELAHTILERDQAVQDALILRDQLRQADEEIEKGLGNIAPGEELARVTKERDQALAEGKALRDQLSQSAGVKKDLRSETKTQELSLLTGERDQARKEYMELRKQFETLKQDQNPKEDSGKFRKELEQQLDGFRQKLEERNREIATLKAAAGSGGNVDEKLKEEVTSLREQLTRAKDELSVAQRGLALSQKALHETRDTLREATEGTSLSRHNFDNLKNECAILSQQNTVLQAQNDQLSRELAATKSKLTTRL
jgi:chromosome segregation ATPase